MYDEIPLSCRACHEMNMVRMMALESRPYSNVMNLRGFECEKCGEWETVYIETAAISDLLSRIEKAKVGSTRYRTLMYKAITKLENLRARVRAEMLNGESKYHHQTPP